MSEQAEIIAEMKTAIVGKTVIDAIAMATEAGWRIRVCRQDGKACIGTRDLRMDRVNVDVVNGVVTDVLSIG